jgi:hypothetical protein
MQRVQYRNVGGTESLWVVHNAGTAPVRFQWAQINITGGTIATTPVQQQIFAPDNLLHRWMPSIAVDQQGNVAIGYSTSNGTAPNFPSIAYAGRLATDPLNTLPQSEVQLIAGAGSQTSCGGTPCGRWGDYTAMVVDPTDDCTFWYTNEYYDSVASGAAGNWHTRVGAFKFPSCQGTTATATLTVTNGGGGTVTSAPAGITCPTTCAAPFPFGTQVTLAATPAPGFSFAGWSGGGCSGTGNCQITLAADTTVSASFTAVPAVLTVSTTGSGTVTSAPAGISCPSTCSATYPRGTSVTLTAAPAAGFVFSGWGGACSGTGTCVVALGGDTSVSANFTEQVFPLSVSVNGSGRVLSTPTGINCGSTCTANFTPVTVVSLTVVPDAGFAFTGWGGACGGVGNCRVPMTQAQSVSANFAQTTGPSSSLFAAVLPSSRSVVVGTPATAFATIINNGGATAPGCSIAPITGLPEIFVFQTTDPSTNALTGTANTPVDIPAGRSQSFVIGLTPTAAFSPAEVPFSFACSNVAQARIQVGLNTLLLSASTDPVPDIVALVATPQNDGILHIPGPNAAAAFAVATVNLGAGSPISVAANTGSATLPLALLVCQTNTATSVCLAPPTARVTTTIDSGSKPTFGIFGTSSGTIPFDPANRRVFVTFSDPGGAVRGSTSVAVTTTQ